MTKWLRGSALQSAGRVEDQLQALLLAHTARVQEYDGVFGDVQRGAVRAWLLLGVDRLGVDPVGEEEAVGLALRLDHGPLDHLLRDGGDAVEAAHEGALGVEGHAAQALGFEQAKVEGGVDLKVLYVQPGLGAGQAGCEQGRDGAEQRRLDGEDDVRAPAALREHRDGAAECEAPQMQDALEPGDLLWDPQRAAKHLGTVDGLGAVAPR